VALAAPSEHMLTQFVPLVVAPALLQTTTPSAPHILAPYALICWAQILQVGVLRRSSQAKMNSAEQPAIMLG
jgi:hypothetical protein